MTRRESEFTLEPPMKGMATAINDEDLPKGTSILMKNVRLFDQRTHKQRLSKRAGLSKYADDLTSSNPIQDMVQWIGASSTADDASGQYRRATKALVTTNGTVELFATTGFTAITNGNGLSGTPHQIFSAPLFGDVFYVDGTNEKFVDIDQASPALATWTPTGGSLPTNPRLIEMWRGRIVLSGCQTDPHNWFMSKLGDPLDWDYGATASEIMAVAGNNSVVGKIGDIVNCMIPYSDDVMIFGCDHSIWQMSGDPASGGRIDNITETLGMPWGRPWCVSPGKEIFFFGSRGGVWKMTPGKTMPENVSVMIEDRLNSIDLETNIIRMAFDTDFDLVHLFITPIAGVVAGTHYVYDVKNEAWMTDVYGWYKHDPHSVLVFDGDDPDDRVLLLGCKDGYIRKVDPTVSGDDGRSYPTECWYNPILFRDDNIAALKEVNVITSSNTSQVNLSSYSGRTAAAAIAATADFTRQLTVGRNYSERRRSVGHRVFIKVHDEDKDNHWAIERIRCKVDSMDSKRKRWLM